MSDQNRDYAAIRHTVEKSLSRQKWMYRIIFFLAHIIFYAVTMLAVWGTVSSHSQLWDMVFNTGSSAAVIVLLPTILWTLVILFHVASLFFESSAGEKALRERFLRREIGEELLREALAHGGTPEKPKRREVSLESERARLSDDGELIEADEDEPVEWTDYHAHTNHTGSS